MIEISKLLQQLVIEKKQIRKRRKEKILEQKKAKQKNVIEFY